MFVVWWLHHGVGKHKKWCFKSGPRFLSIMDLILPDAEHPLIIQGQALTQFMWVQVLVPKLKLGLHSKKLVLILWLCCFLHNPSSPALISIFPSSGMRAGTVIFQHLTPPKPWFPMKISFYLSLAFRFFRLVGGPVLLCFCPYPGREKNNKSGKNLLLFWWISKSPSKITSSFFG